MNEKSTVVEVDVREDIKNNIEPFKKIMDAVKTLEPNQQLILHAPFNPFPLYKVLGKKGFTHQSEQLEKKHWKIIFTKKEVDRQ
ncbi:DUF2249 domain-containing protein [Aquibacillus rhizosphaerae]|uniref:DUF2249 domain-containing protein n=1 Tax=Aquibacillus rhizosphaerae TaxID=3051431 RepID=A0ABT7L3Y9_9BACI|nr:DUF2249 domain-containing protein [Aquibacillus sp. LR5S19]MDL4840585.1 DUF2249 domain-containing protein [Aquibacillus sp. LR5S19]